MKRKKRSKADFIKSQSMKNSAQDVITEARAQGLEINANYVHSVRSEMRSAMRRGSARISPAQKAAVERVRAKTTRPTKLFKPSLRLPSTLSKRELEHIRANAPGAVEEDGKALVHVAVPSMWSDAILQAPRAALVLMAAAEELGLGRAIDLLTNERERVRGILG